MKKTAAVLCTIMLASSLTTMTACRRSDMGLVAGGVVGGFAGNALTGGSGVGTAVGAVGGAYVGHELAR